MHIQFKPEEAYQTGLLGAIGFLVLRDMDLKAEAQLSQTGKQCQWQAQTLPLTFYFVSICWRSPILQSPG